ncbi:MAG: hypothetical protein Q8891_17770 [Bacteroidota bacterium]|nr:hypothetical protein [Bacteroidota bacterium]
MEVHHHPDMHHKKKKFKEYFLEFIMIFLAVTLGFFAENIREYLSDRQKEHADISGLVINLTADSLMVESRLHDYQIGKREIDSLMELIKSGKYREQQQLFYRLAYDTRGSRVFKYSSVTFQQMESSGSLGLIRNEKIRNYLVNYNNTVNSDIRSLETRLLETEKNQADLQNNLLNDTYYPSPDSIIYQHALKTNFYKPGTHIPVMSQDEQAQFLKLYNLLFERNVIINFYQMELEKLKDENAELLSSIKKEYYPNNE